MPITVAFADHQDHVVTLKVPAEMYTWSYPGEKQCFIGIAKSKDDSDSIKLGTIFLTSYSVILNFEDNSVSFGPTAPSEMTILKPEISDTPRAINKENHFSYYRPEKNETETTPAVVTPT